MDKPTGGTLGTTRMWGDSFTVSWLSAGTYQLTFGAEDLSTGNFEVTASGTDQTYCKMASTPHSHTIDIKCYVSGGTLTNSKFFLRFTRATATCRGGIHDTEQGTGAYIYYNQTLTPPAGYTFNYWEDNYQCMCVHEDVNTVENKALGDVVVTYHSLGWPSHPEAAITTAKGSGSEYCMNLQIASDAGNTIVEVNCWNSSGTSHADSSFYQLLLSNPVPNCFAN